MRRITRLDTLIRSFRQAVPLLVKFRHIHLDEHLHEHLHDHLERQESWIEFPKFQTTLSVGGPTRN